MLFLPVGIIGLFILCFYNFYWKRKNLPPGPVPIPLFGNLFQIGLEPPGHAFLKRCRQQYGKMFTYWLGEVPFVAFADHQTINETIVKDADTYTDREFFGDFYKLVRGESDGIFNLNGNEWKKHHNFIQRSMKNVGVGSAVFEDKLLVELEWLFSEIDNDLLTNNGFPREFHHNIDVFIGSCLNLWIFGYTFSGKKSQEFTDIKRCVVEFMKYSGQTLPTLAACNPKITQFLPIFNPVIKNVRERVFAIHEYFNKQIEESLYNEITFADSFVKSFLEEIKLRNGEDRFNLPVLNGILRDFWIAGQDTMTCTVEWTLIYMIHNPDKQAKLQEELDRVIGSNALISTKSRQDLPYCCATINEIQRLSNLLPFNIPRRTTKETTVRGYKLAKGTAVNALISLLNYDEKVFPEPFKFQPERFLNAEGKLKRIESFTPFSTGRRSCIGKELAKTELFIFVSNFFNRYQVLPHGKLPSLHRNFGLSVKPQHFDCTLKPRY